MGGSSDGEMDITAVFGTVVPGSSPGRSTRNKEGGHGIMPTRGHGLVVEHVLAKDETGVRFSLPAPESKATRRPYGRRVAF